jgi:hypothetical protein
MRERQSNLVKHQPALHRPYPQVHLIWIARESIARCGWMFAVTCLLLEVEISLNHDLVKLIAKCCCFVWKRWAARQMLL